MESKKCSICNEVKSLSDYYLYKRYIKKKDIHVIAYHPYCKKCSIEKQKKRQEENKEHYSEIKRQWHIKNKEKANARDREWQRNNKERSKEIYKNWVKNNPGRMSAHQEKYRHEKEFKIQKSEWEACKDYFNNSCAYCGISENESIDTYGKVLHKEHAINKGNNDLSNCLPACTGCNSSKHANDYTEWYTIDNPIYNKNRSKLIINWLNEIHKQYIKPPKEKGKYTKKAEKWFK